MRSSRPDFPSRDTPVSGPPLRLRIARHLLSPGRGEMAEFRGWSRLLRWRGPAERGARRRAVFDLVLRPLVAFRTARAGVRRYGADIAVVAGVPTWRQAGHLWWLRARHDLDALSYRDYQLYRPERRARAGAYLTKADYLRVMKFLSRAYEAVGDGPRIRDKRQFTAWCAEHGLPAVPVLVEWARGQVVYDTRPGGALPADDLFSKPPDATYGSGAARWAYDGRGGYVGRDGRPRSADALAAELAAASLEGTARGRKRSHRMLLMPCLRNDPRLAPLTNGALCTVRIVTYRRPGGRAEFLVATYKMAAGDAPADNFHFGGMLAPVDPATGRLGPALRQQGKALTPVERHPDSGAVIEGFQLPHWEAARALALRAHDAARAVPAFGWDVALTPDGPVLIEGNQWSNPDIAQAPTGRPLGDTAYVAALNAHLRTLVR